MTESKIISVEYGILQGQRPRHAGCNARLGDHGQTVRVPIARLITDDGASGFGRCRVEESQAAAILGQPLHALFDPERGTTPLGMPFDFALWDLMGERAGRPVHALAATMAGLPVTDSLRVPCYDTSLYIDDLHLEDDDEAAALIASEAREGLARNHRAFKIKVGRGARHMPLEAGTQRDIAVIRAVRDVVGADAVIMLDANNGYNLNLTKQVLAATGECNIFWMEEAFHEDRVLYEDLQAWLQMEGLATLIADGEGQASSSLLEWAESNVLDVVQYDIFGYGFTPWLGLARKLDGWGVHTAPHHYGGLYGNYAACHLAPVVERFAYAEWDEATTPGLDTTGYRIEAGEVVVPDAPGFGVRLVEAVFEQAVASDGFALTLA